MIPELPVDKEEELMLKRKRLKIHLFTYIFIFGMFILLLQGPTVVLLPAVAAGLAVATR
jgi:hypothetical protein